MEEHLVSPLRTDRLLVIVLPLLTSVLHKEEVDMGVRVIIPSPNNNNSRVDNRVTEDIRMRSNKVVMEIRKEEEEVTVVMEGIEQNCSLEHLLKDLKLLAPVRTIMDHLPKIVMEVMEDRSRR